MLEIPVRRAAAAPTADVRHAVLRDGARVSIRRGRPQDATRVTEFYEGLSPDAAFKRFIEMLKPLVDWPALSASPGEHGAHVLLAEDTDGDSPRVVALARCEPSGEPGVFEVVLLVHPDWEDRGLGTILLGALLDAAEVGGIRRFRAFVLASNHRMLDMLERFTAIESRSCGSEVIEVVFTRPAARPLPGAARRACAREAGPRR